MSFKVTKRWPISDGLDSTVSPAKMAELIKMLLIPETKPVGECEVYPHPDVLAHKEHWKCDVTHL